MTEPNDKDRERAQALWETPYGNNRREGNVPYSFDIAFAAHRLAAERAKTAEIVAKLRERAAGLRFKGFDLDSIAYDEFADEIESTT